MTRSIRRLLTTGTIAAAFALVVAGPAALGQGHAGGGTIVFTQRRPPREMVGNIRGWASSNRATSYGEDTSAHAWRVNFMAFLPRPPNAAEVVLAWFHVETNRNRRYISNEPIALTNPSDRIFFHTTSLHRAAGEFEPMEHYEAVLSVNDAHGSRELARGQIGLAGVVEHHSGVVDFTGSTPTTH